MNIFEVAISDEEMQYLEKYHEMISKRCKYFHEQADEIIPVKL